ncbi:uncharacterized protein F5891DRAFT_1040384 [Suillus fuscotomentosus]|uniref:D-serine dehydratase n=1 Tax=Suillus fuscotomentosus TaxID=1912939 RepID=A0AAD4HJV3_9AGAM|nr:uncharacterized protein F5891DRAFT_1040384 [Suillus fuscotomentosus]KAG1899263.1 hypothetical protein F5891DRAFT_1040384 [Suillus fuscotomentosus]
MTPILQTKTPLHFLNPDKDALVADFVGKPLNALRTPAFIVDRAVFAENCRKMHENARTWGATFRAHLKTHKTVEGTKLQLVSDTGRASAVAVSTLMEAWGVVQGVKDILYGLPIGLNKLDDLSALHAEMTKYGGTVRILLDHLDQVKFLEEYEGKQEHPKKWSAFIKMNGGLKRAGILPEPVSFKAFMRRVFASSAISVFGFYTHAGYSYGSTSAEEATSYLTGEAESDNREVNNQPFVLSVGSTPTALSATAEAKLKMTSILNGTLELHTGNYPMLDLQQLHTTLIDRPQISQKVLVTVISYYPGRGSDGQDEAMCDAGAIAMSKDTGRIPGFGEVVGKSWKLGRISQEHGILVQVPPESGRTDPTLKIGDTIEIVGQHACLIAAAHSWYYIIDSDEGGDKVVDIWVPWKGW